MSKTKSQIRNKVAEVKPLVAEMGKKAGETAENMGNEIKSALKDANVEEKMVGAKKAITGSATKVAIKVADLKNEPDTDFYVQYGNKECNSKDIITKVKAEYVSAGNNANDIKSVQVYAKPEENAAYYVINKTSAGRVDLF